jgi:hypothetical protein
MHRTSPALLVAISLVVGCRPDLEVPREALIACRSSTDCLLAGQVCHNELCVDGDAVDTTPPDLSEPPTVSPAVGGAQTEFAIHLAVTKPLGAPPTVILVLPEPEPVDCVADGDLAWHCTYRATGRENDALGGQFPFDVELVDVSGNRTRRPAVGVLHMDFIPPTLATRSVAPSTARLGSEVQVFFTASERLGAPAELHVDPPLDLGDGPPRDRFALTPDGDTLNYRFSHVISERDDFEHLAFHVALVDVAGNVSDPLWVGEVQVDSRPPEVTGLSVTPDRVGRTGTVTTTFSLSKPLPEDGLEVTLERHALDCVETGSLVYACDYDMTGQEVADGVEATWIARVVARDAAGNEGGASTSLVVDFRPPSVASDSVVYEPPPDSVLPTVGLAGTETTVLVQVVADEALDPDHTPILTATHGTDVLAFELLEAYRTTASLIFRAQVTEAHGDGAYAARIDWQDVVGNLAQDVPLDTPIHVKTSRPSLVVDQDAVRFVHSPWGNAAEEDLGGFTLPAGPYYALSPAEPRDPSPVLAQETFRLAGGEMPARVRIWSAPGKDAAALMATLSPAGDGWPRATLPRTEVPYVFATGIDTAGNESDAVRLHHGVWIATLNAPLVGASPHAGLQTHRVRPSIAQPHGAALTGAAAGSNGIAEVAAAKEAWLEGRPLDMGPAGRLDHAMAYDAARGRVVLYGGVLPGENHAFFDDTWEWDGQRWTRMTPEGQDPGERAYHAMAYHAQRGRVVLVSGLGDGGTGGGWEWDGVRWTPIPLTSELEGRLGSAMAYDARRGRMVLFGGRHAGGETTDDTWILDGETWASVFAEGPPARYAHAMAYDPVRDRVVLFGGESDTGDFLDDTWVWDGDGWSPMSPTVSPPARANHALVYDPDGERLLLYGGRGSESPAEGDTRLWAWDGGTWTVIADDGVPATRVAHGMVYDTARGGAFVFGGFRPGQATEEAWFWDGRRWIEATPGPRPAGRVRPGIAYDPVRAETVVFGGQSVASTLRDVWIWNGLRWRNATPASGGPTARSDPAMTYDPIRERVLMYGGRPSEFSSEPPFGDTWEWDGTAWTDVTPGPQQNASPRYHPRLAYHAPTERVVLFGGYDGSTVLDDTWTWNGSRWTSVDPSVRPPGRRLQTMAYDTDGGEILLFSGIGDAGLHEDTWAWNGSTWRLLEPASVSPPGRTSHVMAYDGAGARMVIFGGVTDEGLDAGTWSWDGEDWRDAGAPESSPSPRRGAAMAYAASRERLVLFGGVESSRLLGDVWERAAEPERQPAVQVEFSLAGSVVPLADVTGLSVRALAGGACAGGGTGATLMAWMAAGPDSRGGHWLEQLANGAPPTAVGSAPAEDVLLPWSASTAVFHHLLRTRDRRLAFQVRPCGPSGDGEATVAVDYLELQVAYRASP